MTTGPDITPTPPPTIQVGILTKGRPMLATVIANLVLQEEHPLDEPAQSALGSLFAAAPQRA